MQLFAVVFNTHFCNVEGSKSAVELKLNFVQVPLTFIVFVIYGLYH